MTSGKGWWLEDDLELSPEATAYVDSLPTSGGPAQVFANYAARTREEAIAENREQKRREERDARRLEFVENQAYRGRRFA